MGIFSLFGKKNGQKGDDTPDPKSSSRKPRSNSAGALAPATTTEEGFSQSVLAQRHKARATERKIDAIEFEMSRDIIRSKSSPSTKTVTAIDTQTATTIGLTAPAATEQLASDFQSTMPMTVGSGEFLMSQQGDLSLATLAPTESVPVLEEAAILFASGQSGVAEQMLLSWIHQDGLGHTAQLGWYMLFDLYRVTADRTQFESLSLEYARKYETSPPIWVDRPESTNAAETTSADPALPSISFPNKLDGDITKLIDKLQELRQKHRSLKLEFVRVKEVEPTGCDLLLRALKSLDKSGHDLVLVGAQNLVDRLRAILQVGRRDEGEAPWLLLLEVLQWLQLESIFEEASIDYCITFEVSPPAYEATHNHVLTNVPDTPDNASEDESASDRFMMPLVIEGKTDNLISQITDFAKERKEILLDCSLLQRVEFGASAQLLSGLVPLATKKDTTIQFLDVNYLVLALFNAMGLKNVAAIFPRKQ